MKYLEVERLDGIPEQYQALLSELAQRLKRKELLLVVLYFMSELDDGGHSLEKIEKNMRMIFPRDDYREYAASNIRGLFNEETQRVNQGRLKAGQRLWIKVSEGHWRNSALGNEEAKQVLDREELELLERGAERQTVQKEIQRVERGLRELEGRERALVRKVRVNQGVFRKALLQTGSCCRLCGLERRELLVASHIKAWAASTGREKLDPDNGLLLCPDHDALFDRHLITFQDGGEIVISQGLTERERELFRLGPDSRIQVTPGNRKYLSHHRALFQAQE